MALSEPAPGHMWVQIYSFDIAFMIKYTKHNLSRLEELFKELRITIRYEKGNFQSGYCIVFGKNIVIVNKFFDTEARINTLLEILDSEKIDHSGLSEESHQWYEKMKASALKAV